MCNIHENRKSEKEKKRKRKRGRWRQKKQQGKKERRGQFTCPWPMLIPMTWNWNCQCQRRLSVVGCCLFIWSSILFWLLVIFTGVDTRVFQCDLGCKLRHWTLLSGVAMQHNQRQNKPDTAGHWNMNIKEAKRLLIWQLAYVLYWYSNAPWSKLILTPDSA